MFSNFSLKPGGAIQWPVFKWAGGKEDVFFARLSKNTISVYQAPDMGLLDKRSVKLEGIQEFQWSPSEPLIAAYTTEQGNLPARVVLIKVPERTEVRQKNLFSVSGELIATMKRATSGRAHALSKRSIKCTPT